MNTRKQLQSQLNELYTGDQISSHYVYAQNFTYFWCVLMYSAGLPILYPFACLFYMVLYWVYKGLLLKFYARTTKFNEELPLFAIFYIKVGIVLHGVSSLFILSNTELLYSEEERQQWKLIERLRGGTLIQQIKGRLLYKDFILIYIAFWLIIVVAYVFKKTILACIGNCLGWLFTQNNLVHPEKRSSVHSNDFYKELNIKFLKDLYLKASHEIYDLKPFDTGQVNRNRYKHEVLIEHAEMQTCMKKRKEDIEQVINDHVNVLTGNDADHFMEFKDMIELLFKEQNKLEAQQDKDDCDRLRMQTITQSYYMYDAQQFSHLKAIHRLLKSNPDFQLEN